MVDSEKLSLCCSEEGRYLLLGDSRRGGGVEGGRVGVGHVQRTKRMEVVRRMERWEGGRRDEVREEAT